MDDQTARHTSSHGDLTRLTCGGTDRVPMDESERLTGGAVFEFTLKGERRTAVAMLVTDDDVVLLDLVDDERPVWAHRSQLKDVAVFRPVEPRLAVVAA